MKANLFVNPPSTFTLPTSTHAPLNDKLIRQKNVASKRPKPDSKNINNSIYLIIIIIHKPKIYKVYKVYKVNLYKDLNIVLTDRGHKQAIPT